MKCCQLKLKKAGPTSRRKAFPRTPIEIEQAGSWAKRQRHYQVVQMYQQGQPILQIAKQLHMNRITARKYVYNQPFQNEIAGKKSKAFLILICHIYTNVISKDVKMLFSYGGRFVSRALQALINKYPDGCSSTEASPASMR